MPSPSEVEAGKINRKVATKFQLITSDQRFNKVWDRNFEYQATTENGTLSPCQNTYEGFARFFEPSEMTRNGMAE